MKRPTLQFLSMLATLLVVAVVGCQSPHSRFSNLMQSSRGPDDSFQLSSRQVSAVQLSLARTFEQNGELDKARDAYAKVAEADPKNAQAVWRYAVVLDKQGKNQDSETYYRKALKLDPRNSELLCDYGCSLYLKRRWVEAESQLLDAVARDPQNSRAHTNLGLLYAQTDRANEALAQFHKAGCDESNANANLALIHALNQRHDDALRAYEVARAARPNSEVAREGLAAVQAASQKSANPNQVRLASHVEEPTAQSVPARNAPASAPLQVRKHPLRLEKTARK